jgi:hypothetical protein
LPRSEGNPICPACGSSATLPFEDGADTVAESSFVEIVLIVFFLLTILFCLTLALLLSRAALPAMALLVLSASMLWRRKKIGRRQRRNPRRFVCLDCSRNFKA